MHDPIFPAGKSEVATKEDLRVAQDLLDTYISGETLKITKDDSRLSQVGKESSFAITLPERIMNKALVGLLWFSGIFEILF